MNLEEMKQGWNVLNNRLAQNEIVNQRIIKEMIMRKTESAHDILYRQNLRGVIITFLIGAFVLPFGKLQGMPITREAFLVLETYIFLGLLYQGYMFYLLSRFNLQTMNPDTILRNILKYKKLSLDDRRYGIPSMLLIVVICFLLQQAFNVYAIIATVVCLLLGISLIYMQNKRQDRKLKEIEEGLKELSAESSACDEEAAQ
ncbi:MAG: hypothetical protein J6C87_06325 [Bacteroides sp.]|nr:hypothetical protein [Bacteroides sp.]